MTVRLRRALASAAPLLALLLLAACSAQQATTAPAPSPPASASAPAAEAPRAAGDALQPDLSCRVADDCAVKNVGNCCGYFPACVNKDSAVDPAAVRAECERTGTSSVCGFQDIQACECAQGQCRAVSGKALEVDR